jgi:hypothetical protein
MFTPPPVLRSPAAALCCLVLSTACASPPRAPVLAVPVIATAVSEPSPPPVDRHVVLFKADARCTSLEPRSMELEDASPEAAVREVARSSALANLPMSEPKVRVEARSALVDLRLLPGSKRSLHRLSRCEELALLGAIRLTLRANPGWGIAQVIFTDRGDLLAI